jgi:hypothetical protein
LRNSSTANARMKKNANRAMTCMPLGYPNLRSLTCHS